MSKEYAEKKSKKVTTTSTQATVQKNLAPKATENTTMDNVAKGADSSASLNAVTAPKTLPKGGVKVVKTSNSIPILGGTKYDKNALVQEARNYNAQKRYMEKGYASEWMPKETQEIPKLEPVLSDAEVKKQYEEIPNYNIFQRMFNKDNQESYKKKQELSSRYFDIQNAENRKKYNDAGISDEDARWYFATKDPYEYDAVSGERLNPGAYPEYDARKKRILEAISANGNLQEFQNTFKDISDEESAKDAKENKFLAHLNRTLINPFESGLNNAITVGEYVSGKPISGKNYNTVENIQNAISEDMGKTGTFLYNNVAAPVSDMAMAYALGQLFTGASAPIPKVGEGASVLEKMLKGGNAATKLSAATMGLEKSAGTIDNATERGLTPTRIMGEGAASYVTTYLTEKIPFDKFSDIFKTGVKDKTFKGIVVDRLKRFVQGGVPEFGQEIAEDIADGVVDKWLGGDKSEVKLEIQSLIDSGMSKEDAEKQAHKDWLKQTFIDGVSGLLSGGLFAQFGGIGNVNTDNNIPTLEENKNNAVEETKPEADSKELDNIYSLAQNLIKEEPQNAEVEVRQAIDTLLDNGRVNDAIALDKALVQAQSNIPIVNELINNSVNNDSVMQSKGVFDEDLGNKMRIASPDEINDYIDYAYEYRQKSKTVKGIPKQMASIKISDDVSPELVEEMARQGFDISQNHHELNDNDIRHILNSHGEDTNEKYPVTLSDLKSIPDIIANYDDVLYVPKSEKLKGIVYVKRHNGVTYYLEQLQDGNILSNKQMIKVPTGTIPNDKPIRKAITKKWGTLPPDNANGNPSVPRMYVQDVREASHFDSSIPRVNEVVNTPVQTEGIPSVVNGVDTRYTSEDVNLNELQNAEDVSDIRERNYNETLVEDTDAPEEIKAQFVDNPMLYRQLHNADVSARANEILANNSVEEAYRICDKMITEKNPVAVPLSYNLSKALVEQGDFDSAVTLTEKLGQALTEAGQFTQAVTINMLNDNPMAAMEYMNRMIDSMNKEGSEKFGKKWKDFALTESEIEAFSQIEDGDTDAINDLYAQIWARIGQDYPVKVWDKLLEMRRVFLLCNMRTMVRNFTSNLAMLPLRWSGGRATALLESIYQRTNSEYVRTEAKGKVSEQSKKVAKEAEKAYFGDLFDEDAGKYTEARSAIRGAQVFKGTKFDALVDKGATWVANRGINASKTMLTAIDKTTGGAISKFMDVTGIENIDSLMNVINNKTAHHDINPSLLETVRNFTYAMLGEFGDTPFVKANFRQKLASYCEANGITKIEDIPQDAIALCVQEANKATFHDNSKMAQAMEGLRDSFNKVIPGAKLGDLIVTFARTPGNIAARAGEYSPIGAIKGSVEAIKANAGIKNYNQRIADAQSRIDNAKTKSEALKAQKELANYQNVKANTMYQMQQALTLLGQGITGSAALALGIALSRMGFVIGSLSDDKREKQYQQDVQGMQNNSVQIGDLSYSIDFLQPAALPILFGVIVNESLNQQSENFLSSVKQAFVAVGDAWLDSTPMKNVSDMLGGYGTATENVIDTILQLPSSWVPSQVNAITQIGDRTERISYDKSSVGNTIKNSIIAKLPGASETLPAKYDLWGREKVRQDTAGQAAFAKLINPGTTKSTHPTEIDKDILSLYNKTKDVKVLPRVVENSYKIGDTNYQLDNQQKSDMQRIMGENSYTLAEKYVKSDIWKDSNDTAKTMALDSMYEFASALAKREVLGAAPSNAQKMLDIYDKEGINGVFKEITESAKYKGYADELGVDTAKAKEIYENVGEEGMQKYARAVNDAQKLGADSIKTDEWNAYNNGDLSKFNTMIRTRVALENSDVPSTEATQKYIEQHGANAIPQLEEAYNIVSTIPKGKDEYGNQQYFNLTSDMLDIYDKDGAKGLQNYKDALSIAQTKYGADNITTSEYKDYNNGFMDDFNDSVKYRTLLENNDLKNTELNRNYVKEYGESIIPVLQDAGEAITQIQKGVDKYGDAQYFNPNEKMVDVYMDKGKNGVELYADLYTRDDIDDDPNTRHLTDTIPYLYSMDGMSNAEKGYYLSKFVSGKTVNSYIDRENPDYAGLYNYYINKKNYAEAIRKYANH